MGTPNTGDRAYWNKRYAEAPWTEEPSSWLTKNTDHLQHSGQALDIAHENITFPFETLQTIHRSKTGALITASVLAGAIGTGADEQQLDALGRYGDQIGLAFQIVDDLLNATATTEQLGKAAGSDAELGKATYPAYFGVEETRNKALAVVEKAKIALVDFDSKADPLRLLADYIYTRSH